MSPKQRFIDYLEAQLCLADPGGRYSFTKVGPHSFFFRDEEDTIFVKVSNENLIIITDGENVVDHIEMIFLFLNEESDEDLFDHYMQNILAKF